MNDFFKTNFIYLSEILGMPVYNLNNNKKIGHITDVIVFLRDMYPKVSALTIKKGIFRKKFYLSWEFVKKISENKVIFVDNLPDDYLTRKKLAENEISLKGVFLDKQIVDISGSKLVRVNDLHLLKENLNLWVAHMDIGFKGLLRRLGWLNFYESISKWFFSYEIRDKLISWKVVQPITTATATESLHLKIPYTKLSELLPADLADILIDIGPDERIIIFNSLEYSVAARALQELPFKIRIQVTEHLTPSLLAKILNEMPIDEVVDIFAELSKKIINSLFNLLPREKVMQIKELMEHSKNIAGSIMNTEFIAVKYSSTAGEILNRLKSDYKKTESIYYIYVIDDSDSLVGVITLRHLLSSEPEKNIVELMRKKVVKVKIDTNIKRVAQMFYKYDFDVIPVVDKQNKVQGIVTLKDALESVYPEIQEEADEIK